MPRKTALEYAAEIIALREERNMLLRENEELKKLIDDIQDLTGPLMDDEDENKSKGD